MDIQRIVSDYENLMAASEALLSQCLRSQKPYRLLALNNPMAEHLPQPALLNAAFQDYWYRDGQDGRETRCYIGVIMADETLISAAHTLNDSKDRFKASSTLLQKEFPDRWNDIKAELNQRHQSLRESLYFSGLARLHLKQCWRTLSIIEQPTERVAFNWYKSGRSIQKISVEEAHKQLLRLDTSNEHIQIQLQAVAKLPPATPLAKVQNQAPVMRANITCGNADTVQRNAMNCALPLIIKGDALPHIAWPDAAPPEQRSRAKRSDNKLEETPFLPSIRVHRYC
ncbi:MAG: DNA replication terminus site-binding protein [Oceanospirillaceae bacterium]|nr:DNA replication terminus site-binding protein [Oceanospirillaceae bacterium]MCP5350578.1 DNA replication terminus site-binding protein [Oceanospirillaceae bacterium]